MFFWGYMMTVLHWQELDRLVDRLVCVQSKLPKYLSASDLGKIVSEICKIGSFGCSVYNMSMSDMGADLIALMSGNRVEVRLILVKDGQTRYIQIRKHVDQVDPSAFSAFDVSCTPTVADFQVRETIGYESDKDICTTKLTGVIYRGFGLQPP
jgi:hypothetical protein